MAGRFYGQTTEDSSFLNYSSFDQSGNLDAFNTNNFLTSDGNCMPMRYLSNPTFSTSGQCSGNCVSMVKYPLATGQNMIPTSANAPVNNFLPYSQLQQQSQMVQGAYNSPYGRNRYAPYYSRPFTSGNSCQTQYAASYPSTGSYGSYSYDRNERPFSFPQSGVTNTLSQPSPKTNYSNEQNNQTVTLQINNLDYSLDENSLRNFLLNQLKPITPVLSLVFEGSSYAKVTVPDIFFAKQVVSNLHRKKIGHKRMVVSYIRDSSLTEINTLRCQVAGLLKDVPYCTLPMYKFRELFQSRFKTSISVMDLYKMHDICNITTDKNDEKYISLHPDLESSIENSHLMECLQHSVPYCTSHFKKEQHKGWAEQDIEPLPNVFMTISEIQNIIYPLLRKHTGDLPVASLVHCIKGELGIQIVRNENGVNLEHLVCCVQGIQITTNNFGIKILGWLEPENAVGKDAVDGRLYSKFGNTSDPLYQISREVVELVKMSPKSTMKFNRFIPAYHNHFGKQCRVADYGYTRLIELFEALSSVVQIMGDGENRQITLTHRTQIRRFTSDLLRILRSQWNKSILLSQLQEVFSQTQSRNFDITDYGVCEVTDILDGLVNSNTVVVTTVQNGNDILISIPKRKQTQTELEKTCVFAGEVVELFRNAPQYSILFQKFVRSYHYHFGYQCRLSDYGFLKLADLMESIQGIVEIEFTSDEDKRIYLSPIVARRVFAEQLEDLIRSVTGSSKTCMKLTEVLQLHKKKYGYQIQPQTLGVKEMMDALKILPYVELLETDAIYWIICHFNDSLFRSRCYRACRIIQNYNKDNLALNDFIKMFAHTWNETMTEKDVVSMKHAIEISVKNDTKFVGLTRLMTFLTGIVKVLELRTMLISELKSLLNLKINDCFEFGYANLYTLLRAYPDIFMIELGQTHERSEVGLVMNNELSLNQPQTNPAENLNTSKDRRHSMNSVDVSKCEDTNMSKSNGTIRQPLAPNNPRAKPTYADEVRNNPIPIRQFKQGRDSNDDNNNVINNSIDSVMGSRMCIKQNLHNKENSFTDNLNGSFNSSACSDPNISSNSHNNLNLSGSGSMSIADRARLFERRCSSFSGLSQNEMVDAMNKMPLYSYYGPPKPDTPPSDSMPFWIDPVWGSLNGGKGSNVESLNIQLPELKSFNILPMLMSPYSLSKSENMKQMFSFDNTDRKIS